MPDEIEWRPSSMAFFARGELHPFTTPLDLLRFKPLPAGRRGCGWAPRCSRCSCSPATAHRSRT